MVLFLMLIVFPIAIILFVAWIDGEWEEYKWMDEHDDGTDSYE